MTTDAGYVAVGYSRGTLTDLDGLLPPATVTVLEEPEVIESRSVRNAVAHHRCVARLVAAPTQLEGDAGALVAAVDRPPSVRAVLPTVEYSVVAAAALAEAWRLPGAGLAAARAFRDKSLLRRIADAAGLPQPRWQPATSPDQVTAFRAQHDGWCVLKPANLQASIGVQVLGPDDLIGPAWRHTTGADDVKLRARRPLPPRYLVEERLTGPEISVETLVADGELLFSNVTGKSVLPGRYPVEIGHVAPAALDGALTRRITELVAGLVEATGFGSGLLHSEWILVGGDRPHLVECAARAPGDRIDQLIDLAYGGSLVGDHVAVLEGRRPPRTDIAPRAAAIRFLHAGPGVVTGVTGTAYAERADGVHEVSVTARAGDVVEALTTSWQRAGYVLAVGRDAAEAVARADHAVRLVDVTTSDPA
ncbi:ATP-grasp domain-containing protein [Plantactinospora sp. WMMB334]|uniref:ATP-grasp domain-containing protein n=1 Tax=Plantactinospora sp. WMMB334 TaxID=3404119 RepID=UPI003B923ADC